MFIDKKLKELEAKLLKIEYRREDLINKYIIPIEIRMANLRDKIEAYKKQNNE